MHRARLNIPVYFVLPPSFITSTYPEMTHTRTQMHSIFARKKNREHTHTQPAVADRELSRSLCRVHPFMNVTSEGAGKLTEISNDRQHFDTHHTHMAELVLFILTRALVCFWRGICYPHSKLSDFEKKPSTFEWWKFVLQPSVRDINRNQLALSAPQNHWKWR